MSRAWERSSSLNRSWPQYEVEIAVPEVRRPKPWTPISEQELKPMLPMKAENRQVGARARRWQRLMDEGAYPNMSALARAEGVTPAAVSKALIRLRRRGSTGGGAFNSVT